MATFRHSGDLGDIIYSLPAVKALGGGTMLLDITGGADDPWISTRQVNGRTRFNSQAYDTIRPLLLEQPYIDGVETWNGETVTHDLNLFRQQFRKSEDRFINLAVAHLRAFGLDEKLIDEPWLTLKSPPKMLQRSLIVNRTPRHQSKYHWWLVFLPQFIDQAIFMGFEKEHELFEYTFNCKIPFYKAADALEIAQILLGSEQLIGNQSFMMSIAAGLGTCFMQEVYDFAPNCMFMRANAHYM